MQKNIILCIFAILCVFFAFGQVNAKEVNLSNDETYIYVLDDEKCSTVFDAETLEFLQQIFNIFKFLAPILCLCLSLTDFIKAVASQDKEQLMKSSKIAIKRVLLAAVLYCIPTLINFLFDLVGWTGTCGIN